MGQLSWNNEFPSHFPLLAKLFLASLEPKLDTQLSYPADACWGLSFDRPSGMPMCEDQHPVARRYLRPGYPI
jgi:hypothetical protein